MCSFRIFCSFISCFVMFISSSSSSELILIISHFAKFVHAFRAFISDLLVEVHKKCTILSRWYSLPELYICFILWLIIYWFNQCLMGFQYSYVVLWCKLYRLIGLNTVSDRDFYPLVRHHVFKFTVSDFFEYFRNRNITYMRHLGRSKV